jgi:hypothetical protein
MHRSGSVLGRFNLFITGEDSANLGYRVAETLAGKGVATRRHRERIIRLAPTAGTAVEIEPIVIAQGLASLAEGQVNVGVGYELASQVLSPA